MINYNQFKVRRLDSRNQAWLDYKYQLVCYLPYFFEMREWCWEQWGPGLEHEHYINMLAYTNRSYIWLWDCSKYQGKAIHNGKLYLKGDDELSLFIMRWA